MEGFKFCTSELLGLVIRMLGIETPGPKQKGQRTAAIIEACGGGWGWSVEEIEVATGAVNTTKPASCVHAASLGFAEMRTIGKTK